jgi:hypothetical protein
LVEQALTLNPSFARGWYISAWLRLWAGHPDIAIQHAEVSLAPALRSTTSAAGHPAFVRWLRCYVTSTFADTGTPPHLRRTITTDSVAITAAETLLDQFVPADALTAHQP